MSITTVLFDLDGTLLPMDQSAFVKAYFGGIGKKAAPLGYDPAQFTKVVWTGTSCMLHNNGSATNEQVFWKYFAEAYGEEALKDTALFNDFYLNEFQGIKEICGFNPQVPRVIKELKGMGLRLALATNPVFPKIATESRTRWAGLEPSDFELITTYENSHYCKPCAEYYQEVLNALGVSANECVMVGNDVSDDMPANRLGIKTFLLTDCLINEKGEDISNYRNGGFNELLEYIKELKL